MRQPPLRIAHRGDSSRAPENTLQACRRALDAGADMLELDVQRTADGVLVLMHDLTLDRTTNGTGAVAAATWDDIRHLDAGHWVGSAHAGTGVPTLDEALDLVQQAGALVCLEVKAAGADEAGETAELIANRLAARQALGWAVLASFHQEALVHAVSRVPALAIAPELLPEGAPLDPSGAVDQARATAAPIVQRRFDLLDPDLVTALHREKVAVWAWTANTRAELRRAAGTGADGVMSDDVTMLLEVLADNSSPLSSHVDSRA